MSGEVEFSKDEQKEINEAFRKFAGKGGFVDQTYADELKSYITAMALIGLGIRNTGEEKNDEAKEKGKDNQNICFSLVFKRFRLRYDLSSLAVVCHHRFRCQYDHSWFYRWFG